MTDDWHDYARSRGLAPMYAWLAVRDAWPLNSQWNRPVKPADMGELWGDESMRPVVAGMIDDATKVGA